MDQNKNFKHMGRREVNVLTECTGMKLQITDGKEEVNLCQAVQEMIDVAVDEAVQKEREKNCQAVQEMIDIAVDEAVQVAVQKERDNKLQAILEAVQENFVDTCKEFGVSLTETVLKFSKKFGVSENEAGNIVQKYWD